MAIVTALIVSSTIHGARYRVKVCMAYQGRTACKTASAHSQDDARRAAVDGACADIASGVTDTMNCEQAQPKSLELLNGKR